MKYLLNQNTEMGSFQQMHETKGGEKKTEQKKEKESNHWKKKSRLSACLALYRCATQIRDITEWKPTRGGGCL